MDSIAAVAVRIQDRANQLSSEQLALEVLQVNVKDVNHAMQQQSVQNCRVREKLLGKTMTRHTLELDLIHRKREITDFEEKISCLRSAKLRQIDQHLSSQRLEYDRISSTVYAPHEFKMEIYHRKIESKLQSRRNKGLKRKGKLNDFIAGTEMHSKEIVSIHKETELIRDEINAMHETEVREDEEIAAIAMQIRATVAKRTSLRSSLQNTKEENKEANENMLKWEQECIQLSTNGSCTGH